LSIKRIGTFLLEVGWRLMVALLPLTSMPLVTRLTGNSGVAAPAGIILLLFVLGWFLPYLIKRGEIPRQSLPLLGFAFAALLSCALAFFLPLPFFKDASIPRNELEGMLTLGVGVCFFLVSASLPKDEKRLSTTLRWINWSGLAVLLWSVVQIVVWYLNHRYPAWVYSIHELFSIGPLFKQRPTGFTLEPSWLANQLNLLYLPLWLGASTRRYTAHSTRLWGVVSLENVLLAGGAAVLFLSLSRVGLLAFLLMVAYLFLQISLYLIRWLSQRLAGWGVKWRVGRSWLAAGVTAALLAVYLAGSLGIGYSLSRLDPRMANLFHFSLKEDQPFLRYATQLTFASRVVYWQAGWEVFNDHPLLGVGLGNAGLFFPEKMSGYGWGLVEVRKLMVQDASLPNIKSLWVRILAETGILGYAFFICWLFLCWQSTRLLENSKTRLAKSLGLAGKFALLGLLLEGFSLDTFALPYLWFMMGLVAATSVIVHKQGAQTPAIT
jgi:hypothetical protein